MPLDLEHVNADNVDMKKCQGLRKDKLFTKHKQLRLTYTDTLKEVDESITEHGVQKQIIEGTHLVHNIMIIGMDEHCFVVSQGCKQ